MNDPHDIADIYYDINEILEIQPESGIRIQAENIIRNHDVGFFDTEEFHLYHQKNAKKVFRLIFMDGAALGFCYIGLTGDDMLKAPYSAPFSDIHLIKGADSEIFSKILSCLKNFSDEMKTQLHFTLMPMIYDREHAVKTGSFLDSGFRLSYAHVSNYFDLEKIESTENFIAGQCHSFRKNVKRAAKSDLKLYVYSGSDLSDKNKEDIRAYDVIQKNRQEKGFPLAMSFDQIKAVEQMRTSEVDYFVVSKDDNDIAAAIVFKVSKQMVQVIYWGGLTAYSKLRPMEFLAVSLIEYYKNSGISYIDIGPSTADGRISHGLLSFKKNIGCETTLKMSFIYEKF